MGAYLSPEYSAMTIRLLLIWMQIWNTIIAHPEIMRD